MTQNNSEMNSSRSRRWLYGFNLAVLIVLGCVIIGLLMVMTAGVKAKADLTANGLYSLSGSTQQLLKLVDQKGQPYELVSLFPPLEGSNQQNEHMRLVRDILDEYARASKNIKVKDLGEIDKDLIEQQIRARYADEIKPYQEAFADYKKVADDLEKFCKLEAANVAAHAQGQAADEDLNQQAAAVQNLFKTQIPNLLARTKRDVNRYTESTSPDWARAVLTMKKSRPDVLEMPDVEKTLGVMTNPQQVKAAVPSLAPYFAMPDTLARYQAMDDELKAYLERVNKLPPLKVTDVLESVMPNTILVIGPSSVTVVPEASIFKPSQAERSAGSPTATAFEGEQAVSSALMPMVMPDKVKVVFVTTSPTHPTTNTREDGWADMADVLRQANFDVLEWAPPGPQMSPDQPPSPATPPAEGKGVVWIVFPPEPPNPQMMMMGMPPPNPQPVIDALKRHMAAGGQALFLADAAGGGMFGGSGEKYAYDEIVRPFGVDVQPRYTVVYRVPSQDRKRVIPQLGVSRYLPHDITRPMESLQTLFVGAPTIVGVDKNVTTAQASLLVQSPADSDNWGETMPGAEAKFDKGVDYPAPCPLGVAAVKKNPAEEQRIVVLSSHYIGCNNLLEAANVTADEEGHLSAEYYCPGNSELVKNSVLWLAGYKNMIAVGSKSAASQRIASVSPTALVTIRVLLFAGIPFAALLLGGVVWLFRRR